MAIPDKPWRLTGVSAGSRAFAELAAESRGMSLAAWLAEVVRAASDHDATKRAAADDDGNEDSDEDGDDDADDDAGAGECGIAGDGPRGAGARLFDTIERAVHLVGSLGAEPEGPAKTEHLRPTGSGPATPDPGAPGGTDAAGTRPGDPPSGLDARLARIERAMTDAAAGGDAAGEAPGDAAQEKRSQEAGETRRRPATGRGTD